MASDRDTLTDLIDDTRADGHSPREAAAYLLDAGWRPPAREITTAAQADALPYGSVVMPEHCDPFKRKTHPEGLRWVGESFPEGLTSEQLLRHYSALNCPITVLFIPTEEA